MGAGGAHSKRPLIASRFAHALRGTGGGGIVSVVHRSGAAIDAFAYGNFYGPVSAEGVVSSENPYLADR
jgi:hypothetical protein